MNARMDGRMLSRHVKLDSRSERMLRDARASGLLSARGEHRVLRVARTIADLDGSARVRARDLGAALALRPDAERGGQPRGMSAAGGYGGARGRVRRLPASQLAAVRA